MYIEFERSGGFAGLSLQLRVDTATLPEEEAAELQQLVQQSAFFSVPERSVVNPSGADRFNYKLTIERDGHRHTVETMDSSSLALLQPLLERLTRMARSGRYR